MSLLFLHPAAAYLLGLLLVLVLPGRYRPLALLATPVLALVLLEALAARADAAGAITLTWLGMPLQPLRVDGLGLLFARIFVLAGGIGLLYGLHERSRTGHAAIMATVAAALGVVLAGDLLTLFVAWELKALATTAIVATGGMPASMRAEKRRAATAPRQGAEAEPPEISMPSSSQKVRPRVSRRAFTSASRSAAVMG